jgi:hypothetical protein
VRGLDVHELGDGYERRGATTHTVEDRHELGHGGHLHEAGRGHRDDHTNKHGEQDEPYVMKGVTIDELEERRHDRNQHAHRGDTVAHTGALRTSEALKGQDEGRRGEQVEQVNQCFATH